MQRLDLPLNALGKRYLGRFKIVLCLKVHPALGVGSEVPRQAECGIGSNGSLGGADFVDAALRYADLLRKPVSCDSHGSKKVFKQDFAWMHRGKVALHFNPPSVVIR